MVKHKISKMTANIYTFFLAIFNRLFSSGIKNRRVLVVADGLIGDTVLILDFLKECTHFFVEEKGYEVDLFFSKAFVAEFYKSCGPVDHITLIDSHYDYKEITFKDLKNALSGFRGKKYEILINPLPKHKGDRISGCIKAGKKITVRDDIRTSENRFNYLFRKITYTDYTEVEKSVMEFERYKECLRLCGDTAYKTSLPCIPPIMEYNGIPYSDYWVISVGSSENGKKLELEKYAEVVRYIWDRHHFPVVFVGSKADADDADKIIAMAGADIEYANVAGKTTFSEWVEAIRGARFLIGNDSGSVHIAAAVDTPSVCVVGEWQYKRFYPYIIDNDSQYKPHIVNCGKELPCLNCGRDVKRITNEECRSRLLAGKSLKCIEMITAHSVIDVLEKNIVK